jgi:hypothetical protein
LNISFFTILKNFQKRTNMQKSTRFSDMMKNDEQETSNAQTEEAKGYYLLRKNYEVINHLRNIWVSNLKFKLK